MTTTECDINIVVEEVKETSFKEKQHLKSEEELMNEFLDAMNELKTFLSSKTSKLDELTLKIQHLTWLKINKIKDLKVVNEIISNAKDLKNTLLKYYTIFKKINFKGIAKKEIKSFGISIDNFGEAIDDLEYVFFVRPLDKEMNALSKKLAEL